MYRVYKITPHLGCYSGISLVAAENADEANSYIKNFQKRDIRNDGDSWGYEFVDEYDVIDELFAKDKGIVYYGIYYCG